MVKSNYTVTIVAEDIRQVITRVRGFDTLVDAVEYLDVKCTFYTRSAPYIAWSIELVDTKISDTLFFFFFFFFCLRADNANSYSTAQQCYIVGVIRSGYAQQKGLDNDRLPVPR